MMKHQSWIIVCALLLAALHLVVVFPGFFAPYDYAAQNRELPFAPPSRLHFVDASGNFHARPFVYVWQAQAEGDGYEENRSRMYALRFLTEGSSYSIAGHWTGRLHLFGVDRPGAALLF